MKIQKKVPIKVGFTDKSRDINAEKAKIKWENRGWTIVNHIDGGLAKTSYLELEKEEAEKQDTIKKTKNKKLTLKNIGIAFAVLVVISIILPSEEEKYYANVPDKEQVVEILNAVSSDMEEIEKSFNEFQYALQSNNIYNAIRIAEYNRINMPFRSYDNYIKDENSEQIANNLIDKFRNSKSYLQLYYSSFVKYANDQKPSLLIDVQDYLNLHSSHKINSLGLSVTLGIKYDLEFDSSSNSWKVQKNSKKNIPKTSEDVGIYTVNDTQISKINMNTGKEFLSEITVSDYPFTSRDKQAVSITLIQTQEKFIDIHIIKSEIKKGFSAILGKNDIENYLNDKFGMFLFLNGKIYNNLPHFNQTNFVEIKIIEFDKVNRVAIFEISFELTEGNNHKNVTKLSSLRFEIKNSDFDLLKKDQLQKIN
jgi:hypothetical protein